MPGYTAIYDAGQTLKKLIMFGMEQDEPSIKVGNPNDTDLPKILLFLFRVEENGYMRNEQPWSNDVYMEKKPSLALDLHYLITVFPKSDSEDSHNTLGQVMRIVHDNSVIPGSFGTGDAEIKITFMPLTLEEWSKIWTAYPLLAKGISIACLISPVIIESTREMKVNRVRTITEGYGLLDGGGLK